MNTTHTTKVELVKNLLMPAIKANKIAKVTFTKKDGSIREMTLHRAKALEDTVSSDLSDAVIKRKYTLKGNDMLCVEELTPDHKHQFRTINFATVSRVAVGGVVTEFKD